MHKIPKIVHYCWFGPNPIPQEYINYIDKWKKVLGDYKFILWNEENFDYKSIIYAKQAYENGKMAFVSDVARVHALYQFGGIYLDTDVEIIKSPESLYDDFTEVMLGTENYSEGTIGTGFMACVEKHDLFKYMIEFYNNTTFINEDKTYNLTANTSILASILKKNYGILASNKVIKTQNIHLYPFEYFTAYNNATKRSCVSNNTYFVHHFAGSWNGQDFKSKIKTLFNRLLYLFGRELKNKKIVKVIR